jgi:hypothetical protein
MDVARLQKGLYVAIEFRRVPAMDSISFNLLGLCMFTIPTYFRFASLFLQFVLVYSFHFTYTTLIRKGTTNKILDEKGGEGGGGTRRMTMHNENTNHNILIKFKIIVSTLS